MVNIAYTADVDFILPDFLKLQSSADKESEGAAAILLYI